MRGRPRQDPRERLLARVEKVPDGCWFWRGVVGISGYGQISMPRGGGLPTQTRIVHRVAYELFVGPIPEGLTIDHECNNKLCVNPAHLRPMTLADNVRRPRLARSNCPQGHPYDARNKHGYRICRRCERAKVRRHRLKLKAAA